MAVWVFPGQGAQRPHMAAGLGQAPSLLCEASGILGADLTGMCLTDPAPDWSPRLIQPALFIVGVAAGRAGLRHGSVPAAVIGHSFGEYAALTTVGSLSFETGLRLTARRAEAMASCADGRTGMLAVLGLTETDVRDVCAELTATGRTVAISNINSPRQLVLAGDVLGLDEAARVCRARGALRTRRLRVPYAAHTRLMEPAREAFRVAVAEADLQRPAAPLYSCVTGELTDDPHRIAELLVAGMTRTVNFPPAVRCAADAGHRDFMEFGPGNPPRLLGLIRDCLPGLNLRLTSVCDDRAALCPRPFPDDRAPLPRNGAVTSAEKAGCDVG